MDEVVGVEVNTLVELDSEEDFAVGVGNPGLDLDNEDETVNCDLDEDTEDTEVTSDGGGTLLTKLRELSTKKKMSKAFRKRVSTITSFFLQIQPNVSYEDHHQNYFTLTVIVVPLYIFSLGQGLAFSNNHINIIAHYYCHPFIMAATLAFTILNTILVNDCTIFCLRTGLLETA